MPWTDGAARAYERSGEKQRLFGEFRYAAGTWKQPRRVIVKAEHAARGANPRYIVTNLEGAPQRLVVRGDPAHSFRTLLADLATVTRNIVTPRLLGAESFEVTTRLTPLQRKAFELLGVRL